MIPQVAFRPLTLARSIQDRHGVLALVNGELAAVLVRLDHEAHEDMRGHWVIEIGFGPYDAFPGPTFANLEDADAWLKTRAPGSTVALPEPA